MNTGARMVDWEKRLDAAIGWHDRGRIAEAWLEEVHFPPGERIVRAESLEPVHRAVALALAEHEDVYIDRFALPSSNRVRRRWLGLDAASPLEQDISVDLDGARIEGPVWWVWRACEEEAEEELAEERLTPLERLQLAGELELAQDEGYRLSDPPSVVEVLELTDDGAAPWAQSFAEDVLALFADGARHPENGMRPSPNDEVKLAAICPLALAGVPFQDRWAPLVPLTRNRRLMQAIARFLPQDRREQMLLERCETGLVLHAIDGALHALALFPMPRLAGWLEALLADRRRAQLPRDILEAKKAALVALPTRR